MDELLPMKIPSSQLQGKKIGVIGFNARPIASSLKRAGAETYVSDYWGDLDLMDVSDSCIAILSSIPGMRQRQPLNKPLHQILLDNFIELTRDIDIDYIIIGSGFDDYSSILEPLEKSTKLLGCNVKQMKVARNRLRIAEVIQFLDVNLPKQFTITSSDEIEYDSLVFPCICRKSVSGGGSGIRLARHPQELQKFLKKTNHDDKIHRRVIQQYIHGRDISCSILCTGTQSRVLSVQSQLIGMPTAGRNNDFVYCGNYWPSVVNHEIEQKIAETSVTICNSLELKGSIGIDYVVDDRGKLWLMEINPRIQGTLEMLELAGKISVTNLHYNAALGRLPLGKIRFKPCLKMIVYSRTNGAVQDLSHFTNVVDRSPPGVYVQHGDPICTILETGTTLKKCYSYASNIAIQIQREVISDVDRS